MIVALRLLSVSAAALLLAPSSAVDELTFHAEEGTSVVRTFDFEVDMELESMDMTVNGDEVPGNHFEGLEINIVDSDHVVVTDVFGALEDGRPGTLTRTFDELSGSSDESSTGPDGEGNETSKDKSSPLEGSTVVFTWDADDEEYTVEFEDGGDEDLLADLDEDMDLRGFLPEGDVSEGDSWETDIEPFKHLLEAGGDLNLRSDDDERTEIDEQLSDSLEGEVQITFAGTRDEDGVEVAVLELEITASAEGVGTEESPMGGDAERTVSMEFELEGELTWNMQGGHLHGVELTGSLSTVVATVSEFEGGGETMELVQTMILEGTMTFAASVEEQ